MKILLLWVGLITTVKGTEFQTFVGSFIKQDHGTSEGSSTSRPCGTDLLTCVPDFDCNARDYSGAKICPPFFKKIGGACYFRSNDITVKDRTRPDALKFCQALGGNLLFIEREEEFNKLSAYIEKGISYWTEGFFTPKKGGSYNARKESWVWESSINKEINFKLVHPDSGQLEEIKEPRKNLCLSINDTGLYPTSCLLRNPFVCKEGHYDNTCERFESHKCCFTTSYDYYIKNHLKDREAIGTKSQCFVTYNTQTITCTKAYKALESIPAMNFRFENTIYYTMPADEGCGKNTEAVVYSKDLHTTFVRIFSLLENLNIKFRIGLRGIETPTQIKFKWANGRYVDFYEDTYWAPGHPQSQKTVCVMYALTGEGGSYLWHTEENESVCNDPKNFVVCQLPIRSHDFKPDLKKEEGCGERKSRGVLGRGVSFTNADETNFGELPWQTAISVPSFYEDSGFKFVCSGVLISYDSVITSAHCALQRGDSMVVSLGDYDLKQGQKRRKLLYPEFRTVEERIIHPDYRIRPRKNDIAILRLSKAVNYNKFPHIGIACLPTHNLVYGNGDWECYVTGWPAPKGDERSRSYSQVLSRIEVDFTSRDKCDDANSKLSTRPQYRYYGSHGQHFGRSGNRKFLCVEAWDYGSCIEDNTAMLFCKKSPDYLDDPFSRETDYYGNSVSDGLYGSGGQQYGVLQEWIKSSTNIINSYAQERSDNDRWYLLGIGLGGRCDQSSDIMLFESVHEHMAFIHTNVNLAEQE